MDMFLLLIVKVSNRFQMFAPIWGQVFFIDVPTWHEELKALKALFSQFCTHFIGKECYYNCVSLKYAPL
jgi:hypothetical protein